MCYSSCLTTQYTVQYTHSSPVTATVVPNSRSLDAPSKLVSKNIIYIYIFCSLPVVVFGCSSRKGAGQYRIIIKGVYCCGGRIGWRGHDTADEDVAWQVRRAPAQKSCAASDEGRSWGTYIPALCRPAPDRGWPGLHLRM